MRKIFFAIYFSVFFISINTNAAVTTLEDAALNSKQPKDLQYTNPNEGLPDPNNLEEVISFFKKRFQTANVSTAKEMGDLTKVGTMDIMHSKEYIQELQEQNKSTFEKIYDEAMNRIAKEDNGSAKPSTTTFYTQKVNDFKIENLTPDFAVVNVTLPTGNKIIAPAVEHIPYILTTINMLPSGLIHIDEEITVVANGKKLQNGLIKILPKFSTSRSKVRKKIDIDLLSVSINDEIVPHILEEIGDKIYIKPKEKYTLTPGVYNYKFSYILDRKLWYYDDFTEFYWDISGGYFNLVIGSANAIISIPDGKTFLSQSVLSGFSNKLTPHKSNIFKLANHALGVTSVEPLLPGENMHVLLSLDKNVFLSPDFNRSFAWFINDYGDILFILIGLSAIIISYMISWKYIKKNKTKMSVSFKNSAPAMRYFLKNIFDTKSFVSFLIDLRKKQYIDIQKQDGKIIIIKKTDHMPNLTKGDKKVLNNLFLKHDSVISVSSANTLKFKRAYNDLKTNILKSVKRLNLKLNLSYLFFSVSMLILTEAAISFIGINSWQTAIVLFSSTLSVAFYTYILRRKFSSKILSVIVKILAAIFVCMSILIMSIYVHLITAILIAATILAIYEYSSLFSNKNGLIKSKTKEAENLKQYLEKNIQIISISQEFTNQQANIYALELDVLYSKNDYNKKSYILDIAKELEHALM